MINRVSPWVAFLPLLVVLLVYLQVRQWPSWSKNEALAGQSYASVLMVQATAETAAPDATPTAPRRRPTPTPLLPTGTKHNPGLIVGAVIVVAIILIGVLRFTRLSKT